MAAMRLQAVVRYRLDLVLLSLFLAVAISWVGLWLTFQVREDRGNSRRKLLNALVMGSAIPVMHYTGMASTFSPSNHPPNLAHAMSISSLGTTAIAVGCFVVLIFVSGTAFVHRRLESQKVLMRGLQKSEAEFRNLAEAFPEMIWTARSDGSVDYYNRHWDEYTGRKFEDSGGWSWDTAVHPEDLPACLEKWRHSLQAVEIHEVEIRLRSADGGYRWHLIRAVPVRDANRKVVKWFGSGTDIEKQKRSQQTLEEQVQSIPQHWSRLMRASSRRWKIRKQPRPNRTGKVNASCASSRKTPRRLLSFGKWENSCRAARIWRRRSLSSLVSPRKFSSNCGER